jgi:hypothetical protein
MTGGLMPDPSGKTPSPGGGNPRPGGATPDPAGKAPSPGRVQALDRRAGGPQERVGQVGSRGRQVRHGPEGAGVDQ